MQCSSYAITFCTHTSLMYRGADLNALVREAAITALKEYMHLGSIHDATPNPLECSGDKDDVSNCVVEMRHFTAALLKVSPSVSTKVCVWNVLEMSWQFLIRLVYLWIVFLNRIHPIVLINLCVI